MSFEKPWGNYLLDGIVETIAPQAVSFWPQTLAWQLLLLLFILFTIKKCYQQWQNYQNNSYRREALAWLAQCSLTNEESVRQLPALLRKTALLANEIKCKNHPKNATAHAITHQDEITQLLGAGWTTWLDEHCTQSQFSHQANNLSPEKLLSQLAYMPKLPLNDSEFKSALKHLCQQIEIWIKYHQLNGQTPPNNLGEQT